MIALLQDLAHDELGIYTAAILLIGVALGIVFLAVCFAWERSAPTQRTESLSQRHDRLDAEALARTRPTSSSRKSGRVRTGGA